MVEGGGGGGAGADGGDGGANLNWRAQSDRALGSAWFAGRDLVISASTLAGE